MKDLINEINRLKEEKDALIVAHYYVEDEVQQIADFVGDSFYLSKVAKGTDKKMIVFCGVRFMGESAKIMNPEKTVLMPDSEADCPMAHMASVEKIKAVREKYDDVAVVCYINSSAELKSHSDVCVTSSNALKIVSALPNKNIFFIPDEHLGRYISTFLPEKNFIFNDGFCHVHTEIDALQLEKLSKEYPDAEILVHPECHESVSEQADFIGSTSEIIDYATESPAKEFIVCTETGVFYELKKKNPDKEFYAVNTRQICTNMKKITLEKVRDVLRDGTNEVEVNENSAELAKSALENMMTLAK